MSNELQAQVLIGQMVGVLIARTVLEFIADGVKCNEAERAWLRAALTVHNKGVFMGMQKAAAAHGLDIGNKLNPKEHLTYQQIHSIVSNILSSLSKDDVKEQLDNEVEFLRLKAFGKSKAIQKQAEILEKVPLVAAQLDPNEITSKITSRHLKVVQ